MKLKSSEIRALAAFVKLQRAAEAVAAALVPGLAAEKLTQGQFAVLEALYHLGPLLPGELCRKLLRSGGNVTTVVDNLEKHGLCERQREQADRRRVKVRLTPAGERVVVRVFPTHAARIAELFAALSPAEQEELGRLCKKLGKGAMKS